MSSVSFCVVFFAALVAVHSYVIREPPVSFIDSVTPEDKANNNAVLLQEDKAENTIADHPAVVSENRSGLDGINCPYGYLRAGPTCIKETDYDSESVEIIDRSGIVGDDENCPDRYKRVGPTCLPIDSESTEEDAPKYTVKRKSNNCPSGYVQAGPTCIPGDFDSDSDEY